MRIERHKRIGLGIVGSATPVRDGVRNEQEVADDSFDAIGRKREQVDTIIVLEATLFDFPRVDEEHIALTMNAGQNFASSSLVATG